MSLPGMRMPTAVFIMIAMLMLIAMVGCETTTTTSPETEAVVADRLIQPEQARALGYRFQWPSNIVLPEGARVSHAEAYDDLVVIQDTRRGVSVFDADDAALKWYSVFGEDVDRIFPHDREGKLLIINTQNEIYLHDIDTGRAQQMIRLDRSVSTGATSSEFAIYLGTRKGRVLALTLSNGLPRWEMGLPMAINIKPQFKDQFVIATDTTGSVAAMAADRQNLLWIKRTFGPITAPATIDGNLALVACEDQFLYAYDIDQDGKISWKYPSKASLVDRPFVHQDQVYQLVPGVGLVVLDRNIGDELYIVEGMTAQPFAVRGDDILLFQPGRLIFMRASDGTISNEIELPRVDRIVTNQTVNGNLYLIDDSGYMTRLTYRD